MHSTTSGKQKVHPYLRLASIVVLACLCGTPSLAEEAPRATAIKDIIPHKRPGNEACFEGSFTDKAVDMTQWPSYAEQREPKKDADGNWLPSSVSHELTNQAISNVALYLNFTDGRRLRNESWDLDFTVRVTSPTLGADLFARSGCTWSGWNNEQQRTSRPSSCWPAGSNVTAGACAPFGSPERRASTCSSTG